mmetsp:Transcript_10836/g.16703  ORF Transcript_10836/g.16703 Transcript_10836/m.16703 type:complete len:332 (-) Transcript_10836:82-1077(-)|eukprot:CAMPEP_0195292472 /NCGR_PEP_ID=MMETSP0707-20130614/9786_1 /TAXON_ID=33640 /ORGANISM="Asterionellopsis glacialis, Strain CCMP134" /LENGTH=331 /DNA_ID=CAMNT_0040352947 /DNA_START=75 /DNA_END=1070 /DNA_ORIENTATION=+
MSLQIEEKNDLKAPVLPPGHGKKGNGAKHAQTAIIDDNIPSILLPWVKLNDALPKHYVPLTKLDLDFILLSCLFFTLLDFGSAEVLQLMGWPSDKKETRAAAGSLTTIFHSTTLVLSLGACLWSQRHVPPSAKMNAHPKWCQKATTSLIQYCTGYMIYDSLIQFGWDRWVPGVGVVLSGGDKLFLGHHVATSFYMLSALVSEAGHVSALLLMFVGESTAPVHNCFRISRLVSSMEDFGGQVSESVHQFVALAWAVKYSLVRTFVGPACGIYITYDLLFTKSGRANVPLVLSSCWLFLCWGVMIGSIPWIIDALKIVIAHLHGETEGLLEAR